MSAYYIFPFLFIAVYLGKQTLAISFLKKKFFTQRNSLEKSKFIIGKLSSRLSSLNSFFQNLERDRSFSNSDFTLPIWRERRFSTLQIKKKKYSFLETNDFDQGPHNHLFKNKKRKLSPLNSELLKEPAFLEIVDTFANKLALDKTHSEIGVHQIRSIVDVKAGFSTAYPAPEGVHKDGFDYIGIFVINTENVSKGKTYVCTSSDLSSHCFKDTLEASSFIIINDKLLYHFTEPFHSSCHTTAYRDIFVLTVKSS